MIEEVGSMSRFRTGTKRNGAPAAWRLAVCLSVVIQFSPQSLQAGQTQAGKALTPDEILHQAKGAFNDKNLVMARQWAEKIRDVQGSTGDEARSLLKTIADINANNPKMQTAKVNIQRGRFKEACVYLREIQAAVDANMALKESYPELSALKVQAGGCQAPAPEVPDTVKSDYEKAVSLRDAARLQEALTLFRGIARSHPGYQDVEQQIKEINQELSQNLKKSQDERFAEHISQAERSLGNGEFRVARRELNAAEALRPSDSNVPRLKQQLEAAVSNEVNELGDALAAYYGGQYEQAQKALESFLLRRHSPSLVALARFYQGAAVGSRFLLAGAKDETNRNAALQLFRQTLKDDPAFLPRWDTLSPRIKDMYQEATRK